MLAFLELCCHLLFIYFSDFDLIRFVIKHAVFLCVPGNLLAVNVIFDAKGLAA